MKDEEIMGGQTQKYIFKLSVISKTDVHSLCRKLRKHSCQELFC